MFSDSATLAATDPALWNAITSQQHNFDDAGSLNHQLFKLGLEVPDSLDRVLSKSYRPKNPV